MPHILITIAARGGIWKWYHYPKENKFQPSFPFYHITHEMKCWPFIFRVLGCFHRQFRKSCRFLKDFFSFLFIYLFIIIFFYKVMCIVVFNVSRVISFTHDYCMHVPNLVMSWKINYRNMPYIYLHFFRDFRHILYIKLYEAITQPSDGPSVPNKSL